MLPLPNTEAALAGNADPNADDGVEFEPKLPAVEGEPNAAAVYAPNKAPPNVEAADGED